MCIAHMHAPLSLSVSHIHPLRVVRSRAFFPLSHLHSRARKSTRLIPELTSHSSTPISINAKPSRTPL